MRDGDGERDGKEEKKKKKRREKTADPATFSSPL